MKLTGGIGGWGGERLGGVHGSLVGYVKPCLGGRHQKESIMHWDGSSYRVI